MMEPINSRTVSEACSYRLAAGTKGHLANLVENWSIHHTHRFSSVKNWLLIDVRIENN